MRPWVLLTFLLAVGCDPNSVRDPGGAGDRADERRPDEGAYGLQAAARDEATATLLDEGGARQGEARVRRAGDRLDVEIEMMGGVPGARAYLYPSSRCAIQGSMVQRDSTEAPYGGGVVMGEIPLIDVGDQETFRGSISLPEGGAQSLVGHAIVVEAPRGEQICGLIGPSEATRDAAASPAGGAG